MPEIVALIPARGGSKGLPKKNIIDLYGQPLISWSINFALSREEITKVIVSTDAQEIADTALLYGAEVPFLRSPNLATDDAATSDVIQDVIHRCKLQDSDTIILLEPTSPYRDYLDFEKLLELLFNHKAEKIMSVSEAVCSSFMFQYLRSDQALGKLTPVFSENTFSVLRRQDLPKSYFLDGTFYASTVKAFIENPTFLDAKTHSLISNPLSAFEVDSFFDLQLYRSIFQFFGPPSWPK